MTPNKSFREIRHQNPIIRWIQKRLYKQNKNWLAIMTGATGSGKSWSSLKLAETIDPGFDPKKIIMESTEFLENLKEDNWGQGDCIVWDEAGTSLGSKEYMTVLNRSIEDILETFRRRNIAVIFTVPSQKNIDKDVRRLLHAYMETRNIDYINERVKIKLQKMQYNPKLDKIYYHSPKIRTPNKPVPLKISSLYIGKPSKDLIRAYEAKRDKYQKKLTEERLNRVLEKKDDGESKEKEKERTKKDKIKEELIKNPNRDPKDLAMEYDTTPGYVREIRSLL